jgi:hypothetical protein
VTRAEFEQIVCNRCGACCEVVWQPAPLAMAVLIGRNAVPGEMLAWWSDLEPSAPGGGTRSGALQKYRCLRFVRQADGAGFCSRYDERPQACRTFPDGEPVHAVGFEACSWNVDVVDDGP